MCNYMDDCVQETPPVMFRELTPISGMMQCLDHSREHRSCWYYAGLGQQVAGAQCSVLSFGVSMIAAVVGNYRRRRLLLLQVNAVTKGN